MGSHDLEVISRLQEALAPIAPLLAVATHLGDEAFYVLVFPLIYWCLDRRLGLRLGVMLLLSAGLNAILKLLLATPRPWFLDPDLGPGPATSFGMPSGHAQNAVAVWGLAAADLRRVWAVAGAVAAAALIGLSRLQLGAHFAGDVVAGWLVGTLLLVVFLRLAPAVEAWLGRRGVVLQALVPLAGAATLLLLGWGAWLTLADWRPPAAWVGFPADAASPARLASVVAAAGGLLGFAAGAHWQTRRGGFVAASGAPRQRLARGAVGVAVAGTLWAGGGALLPGGDAPAALAWRLGLYAALGLWVGGVAPALFLRLGWLERTR